MLSTASLKGTSTEARTVRRSNSPTPVGSLSSSRASISDSVCTRAVPASAAKRFDDGVAASATVSTSVFHASHPGHCPCHFDEVAPHSVQE